MCSCATCIAHRDRADTDRHSVPRVVSGHRRCLPRRCGHLRYSSSPCDRVPRTITDSLRPCGGRARAVRGVGVPALPALTPRLLACPWRRPPERSQDADVARGHARGHRGCLVVGHHLARADGIRWCGIGGSCRLCTSRCRCRAALVCHSAAAALASSPSDLDARTRWGHADDRRPRGRTRPDAVGSSRLARTLRLAVPDLYETSKPAAPAVSSPLLRPRAASSRASYPPAVPRGRDRDPAARDPVGLREVGRAARACTA